MHFPDFRAVLHPPGLLARTNLKIGVYEGPAYLHLWACPVRERHVVLSRTAQTRSKEYMGRGRNECASLDPTFTKGIRFSGKILMFFFKNCQGTLSLLSHLRPIAALSDGVHDSPPSLLNFSTWPERTPEFFQLDQYLDFLVYLSQCQEKRAILHEIKMLTLWELLGNENF